MKRQRSTCSLDGRKKKRKSEVFGRLCTAETDEAANFFDKFYLPYKLEAYAP